MAQLQQHQPRTHAAQRQQQPQTYDVQGSEVTTPYNVRLQLKVTRANCGPALDFAGDAAGIFTSGCSPLQKARLRTQDLEALKERGKVFFFDFRPNQFQVRFYDPNDMANPLGELRADPVPPAGNPAYGTGSWTEDF